MQPDCNGISGAAQGVAHVVEMDDRTKQSIAAVISRMPEWIRHDLVAKDVAIRARAEETLAAMIASALDAED